MIDDYEQDFYETVYDADGNPQTILKQQISKREEVNGWSYFDTSHGHCGLCGSLGCNGRCFK